MNRLNLPFQIADSQVVETFESGLAPQQTAEKLALEKAGAVSRRFPDHAVLAGDTLIHLEGEILGKPGDPEKARQMLARLSGRVHEVITGLALIHPSLGLEFRSSVVTRVRMKSCTATQIRRYVACGEPLDKAGAYAIQEEGGKLVAAIEGCYNNVMGLPLCETAVLLGRLPCIPALPAACIDPQGKPCPRIGNR